MTKIRAIISGTNTNRFRPSYIPNLDGVGDIVPAQVEPSTLPPWLLGWRRLACAVIEDALRCAGLSIEKPVLDGGGKYWHAAGVSRQRQHEGRRRYQDAIAYLTGQHSNVALPIEVACALAGLDEQALRERVLSKVIIPRTVRMRASAFGGY